MVEDGESEKSPKGYSHRRREASGQSRVRGEKKGTDATVWKIREKSWKEDVREKTEVKAIGQ